MPMREINPAFTFYLLCYSVDDEIIVREDNKDLDIILRKLFIRLSDVNIAIKNSL